MAAKQKESSLFLRGNLVALRAVEESDMPAIARWLNDPAVTYYLFYGQLPMGSEAVREMIRAQIASRMNVVFTACDRKTGIPIGLCGLYDIHLTARKAEFRILVGERRFWGKGYGTEITELLTFYAFDRLNLHRVWLGVTSENKGAIRAYERAGYVHEGALRDDIYRNSRYYHTVRMGILRGEYSVKYYKRHAKRFG